MNRRALLARLLSTVAAAAVVPRGPMASSVTIPVKPGELIVYGRSPVMTALPELRWREMAFARYMASPNDLLNEIPFIEMSELGT